MSSNNPMFDLEDCEDVELNNNKASSDKFLRAKNIRSINANNNESSAKATDIQKTWHETVFGKIIIGLIIGIILLITKIIFS